MQRIVAGVMLVAFASYVLHGSAMARVGVPGQPAAISDHSSHRHGDGAHSHGAAEAAAKHDDASDQASASECCGNFCATAIAPVTVHTSIVRTETTERALRLDVGGTSLSHEALRRPPRTLGIA
jgi:hypothetical protein